VEALLKDAADARSVPEGGGARPLEADFLWTAKSPSGILTAAFSREGKKLTTAEGDGTVRLRATDTGKVLTILRGHQGPVYTVAFAPDGQTLASAGLDRTVKIWRVATNELLTSFDSGNTELVNCLAFSHDGKTLAVGGGTTTRSTGRSSRMPTATSPTRNVARTLHACLRPAPGKSVPCSPSTMGLSRHSPSRRTASSCPPAGMIER
jgi:WD40 repeat protein